MSRSAEFWRVRDAWYSSVIVPQMQRRAENVQQAKDVLKEQREMLKAMSGTMKRFAFYKLKNQLGRGALRDWGDEEKSNARLGRSFAAAQRAITFDPAPLREFAKMAAELLPQLFEAMDEEIPQIAINAFSEWPVKTGMSKGGLDLQYVAENGMIKAKVIAAAPYLYFIKGHPHKKIDNPAAAAVDRILQRLGDKIDQAGRKKP